jgi:hypothetical protein
MSDAPLIQQLAGSPTVHPKAAHGPPEAVDAVEALYAS